MYSVWHLDLVADMPASLINDQDDPFGGAGSDRCSEFGQHRTPEVGRHRREQQPEGLAACGADKPIQICPFVAMLDDHNRAVPFLAPDTAQNWFEADTMLILAPELDCRLWVLSLDLGYSVREGLFLTFPAPAHQPWHGAGAEHRSGSQVAARVPSRALHGPFGQACRSSIGRL